MSTTPERAPLHVDPEVTMIFEKPTKYPLETLQRTFSPEDIATVSRHQERLKDNVEGFMDHIFPPEFEERYRRMLPLLTYNVTMYPELEKEIASDPIIQALRSQRATTERTAQAMRARRSILALTLPPEEVGA